MDIVVAHEGGEAAGIAQKTVEKHTGIPVITSQNATQLNQGVTDLLEGTTASPERQDMNELRFSNTFVEKRSSSYLKSPDLSRLFPFALQKYAQQNARNVKQGNGTVTACNQLNDAFLLSTEGKISDILKKNTWLRSYVTGGEMPC